MTIKTSAPQGSVGADHARGRHVVALQILVDCNPSQLLADQICNLTIILEHHNCTTPDKRGIREECFPPLCGTGSPWVWICSCFFQPEQTQRNIVNGYFLNISFHVYQHFASYMCTHQATGTGTENGLEMVAEWQQEAREMESINHEAFFTFKRFPDEVGEVTAQVHKQQWLEDSCKQFTHPCYILLRDTLPLRSAFIYWKNWAICITYSIPGHLFSYTPCAKINK